MKYLKALSFRTKVIMGLALLALFTYSAMYTIKQRTQFRQMFYPITLSQVMQNLLALGTVG